MDSGGGGERPPPAGVPGLSVCGGAGVGGRSGVAGVLGVGAALPHARGAVHPVLPPGRAGGHLCAGQKRRAQPLAGGLPGLAGPGAGPVPGGRGDHRPGPGVAHRADRPAAPIHPGGGGRSAAGGPGRGLCPAVPRPAADGLGFYGGPGLPAHVPGRRGRDCRGVFPVSEAGRPAGGAARRLGRGGGGLYRRRQCPVVRLFEDEGAGGTAAGPAR